VNPSRELAILVGPTIAGFLLAAAGPGAVYAFDAATYALLVGTLALLHIPPIEAKGPHPKLWSAITEGISFVRRRPIIWQLMTLDLSATLFGAYRVILPAFATDVLGVGPLGYGLLNSAPSAGALIGSALVFKLVKTSASGQIVLASTVGYGLAAIGLAQAPVFALAMIAAGGLGLFDALATTIRHAAVQLETPDELRGRVTSIYQMASRGGPALGDVNIGWIAGLTGPVAALTLGGMVPVGYAALLAVRGGRVRDYSVAEAPA
jgi:MFS family permease